MTDNTLIAVDLGSSQFKMMAAEVKNSKVKVLAVEELSKADVVRAGVVEQPTGAADMLIKLGTQLRNRINRNISSMYLSLNGKTMKHFPLTVERTFRKAVKITDELLVEMENECRTKITKGDVCVYDIIPLEYVLDNQSCNNPVGRQAYRLQATYNTIVGNVIIRDKINQVFDRTQLIMYDFTPLTVDALAEAVLLPDEREDGTAIVNLGATTTTLAIYHNDALKNLMVVPFGSMHITKDIAELNIAEEKAEKLKKRYGEAKETFVENPVGVRVPNVQPEMENVVISTQFLAKIIEARLDEMLAPVFLELKNNSHQIGTGVVLTGGGSKLSGIAEYMQERTDMPVRYGDHADKLTNDTAEQFLDPDYAQLIGTFLLVDSYQKEHPELTRKQETKKPKLIERVKQFTIGFFDYDNKFEDNSQTAKK